MNLISGKVLYFGIQPKSNMTGPDSWFAFHVCNKHGDCCTTRETRDVYASTYKNFNVKNNPGPCSDIVLDSQDPGESLQTVEVEHFGPIGLEAAWVNFRLLTSADVFCSDPN